MKVARSVCVVVIVAAASGCSSFLHSDAQPDQTYLLRPAPVVAAAMPAPTAPSLRIGRTLTAPGLDGDRIVLVRSDRRIDYYAASRWAATIPQMVEDLAAEMLRTSGEWSSVHDSQGAFPTDYFLQLDIRRFEADYSESANPKVHVVVNGTLGRRIDRELLSSFVAEGTAAAGANRLGAVVEAFEKATSTALAVITERTSQALKTSTAQSTP
jgi:cholesterol transport system auxiliary component